MRSWIYAMVAALGISFAMPIFGVGTPDAHAEKAVKKPKRKRAVKKVKRKRAIKKGKKAVKKTAKAKKRTKRAAKTK